MRRQFALGLVLAFLAGCGGSDSGDRKPEDGEPPDPNANVMAWPEGTKTTGGVAVVKLEGVTTISLSDLLGTPRAELASQAEQCEESIHYSERLHAEGRLPFLLLPNGYASFAVPVLRQAKYSAGRGFSVPPYLAEDRRDPELALHLARFGDLEAARKLLNPADLDALRQLEALQLERNYPVEWTRLVGLLLRRCRYHVLVGNVDEVKQLIGLHQQLEQLLGPKARISPLGVALRSRGRAILREAAAAWRENKQDDLASQAETLAAAWGELPRLELPWQPNLGSSRAEQVFAAKRTGKVVSAPVPLRVVDLLGLPIPDYGLESAIATFDGADRLGELLLLYRTREEEYYPRPEALSHLVMEALNEASPPAAPEPPSSGMKWQRFEIGPAALEVGLVRQNPAVTAMVRVHAVRPEAPPERPGVFLPRAFGFVDLDRSFEQIRQHVALHQRAKSVTVSERAGLDQVQSPITNLPPTRMMLDRAAGQDVLTRVTLHFDSRQQKGRVSLTALAGPLWALGGQAVMDGGSGPRPLRLAWEDEQTAFILRLPNRKDQDVTLEAYSRDRQAPRNTAAGEWADRVETDVSERAGKVQARARDERRVRLTAGAPWTFLPRDLEKIRLGMSRAEIQQVLPPEFKAYHRPVPGGVLVTMTGPLPTGPVAFARELCALFDAAGRVAEVRVKYQSNSGPGALVKLETSLEKRGGAPEDRPGPWARLWADLPHRKPAPLLHAWQDDLTRLTCQQDAYGVELRLRDCPLDQENGVAVPPLAYLPRGPEGCLLGTTREALLRKWKVASPTLVDGGLVLAPKASSSLDALLVWFRDERVSQVIGRHKLTSALDAAHAAAAVTTAWGREGRSLGLPWRQDFSEEGALQSWTTHDDQTRVRIFWQQRGQDGGRLVFTQWRDLSN